MRLEGTATAIELGSLTGRADGRTKVRIQNGTLYVDSGSETQITIHGLDLNQIELDETLCNALCAKVLEKVQQPHPEQPIAKPPEATQLPAEEDSPARSSRLRRGRDRE